MGSRGATGRSRTLVVGVVGLAALLATASVAEARAPIIAYVDQETDKLALFDVETGTDLPAPNIEIPGPVRRYAVSHDGRYVFYADGEKDLHLFERGTNAEVPLPGVDVYETPGGLTVADTGLIAFDNNGNGPAVVYDSNTGSFVDVGFPPENKHRQTRLSADGRFLATTCNDKEKCVEDRGEDSNLFVHDVVQKADVPVPDNLSGNDERDEEHPCIDGDGSLVGVDIPSPVERDVYLYDFPTESSVFPEGLNDPEGKDLNCALDSSGGYIGWQLEAEPEPGEEVFAFLLLDRATGQLVDLPSEGRAFTTPPVWLTDPYPPPLPPASPPSGDERDTTAPSFLGPITVTNKRFRAARASARRTPVGTRFIYRLSEPASVKITIERRAAGRRVGRRCVRPARRLRDRPRCKRWLRRGQLSVQASAGRNSTRFSGRLRRRALAPGRYRARFVATDAAGNRSAERRVSFRIVSR